MPFLASALDKGSVNAHMTEAVVAARSVKGKEAQIDFKTEYVDIDEPYDCLRTNRIERIGSDGRVEYETDCKYRKIREARSRLDSVWVKVAEAHALKPGDLVSFWQTKDKAAIVFVRGEKGKTLVQVRGDRVKQGGP